MKWVGIDTNVLVSLMHGEKTKEHLLNKFASENLVLCVPHGSLMETLDSDRSTLDKELEEFAKFGLDLGAKFKISRQLRSIMKEEIEHFIGKQPTLSPKTTKAILEICSQNNVGKRKYLNCRDLGSVKDHFNDADKLVVQNSHKFKAEEVLEFLNSYSSPSPQNMWIEKVCEWYPCVKMEMIRQNKTRYYTIWIWSAFQEFYAMGLSIDANKKGRISHDLIPNSGRDRGSHQDNLNFAEVSRCHIYVSSDENFLARAKRLKERQVHELEILSLNDFLTSYV